MEYVIDNGIRLSNNSWGGGGFSQALYYDVIAVSQVIGHLFVAAAGNRSFDNDVYPFYPASYELPNIIAVAATDNDDNLASFSNWGASTVDLGAPGVDIYSTMPESGDAYHSGTSMATPHVTGVVALVMGRLPTASWQEVRNLVLMTVRPVDSLSGLTVTGGVVNAEAAAGDCNGNGIPDGDDITGGTSADCTGNGIPDECEPDCNSNGVADSCDVAGGTSEDCNNNGVPDECEPGGTEDCNGNGIADLCDIYTAFSEDCNHNFVPDECELAAGTEDDCNGNGVLDVCDLAGGTSLDCNENRVPDECDLVSGNWPDVDQNGVPDSCEVTRLFVNPEATGLNNGLTWADALTDLAVPLVMAANPEIPLTEIWVAAGTFKPDRGTGNRMETFRLVDGVALYGGFAGGEVSLEERNPSVNVTILSGDLNGDDEPDFQNVGENSYHVVDGSEIGTTAVLDGFTITGGSADSLSDLGEGAGLYIFDGSPTVRDCVFTRNSAVGPYGWGGGRE